MNRVFSHSSSSRIDRGPTCELYEPDGEVHTCTTKDLVRGVPLDKQTLQLDEVETARLRGV